ACGRRDRPTVVHRVRIRPDEHECVPRTAGEPSALRVPQHPQARQVGGRARVRRRTRVDAHRARAVHARALHRPRPIPTPREAVAAVPAGAFSRGFLVVTEVIDHTVSDPTEPVPVAVPPPIELIGGPPPGAATLEARDACAWFGDRLVLEGVDLVMPGGEVT